MNKTKLSSLRIKSLDQATGEVTAYVSAFGVVDLDNEVVDKGAFSKSITDKKGRCPVLWQHRREEPVGWGVEAKEDDFGLLVKFRCMMDSESGRQAFNFIQLGLECDAPVGFSIGFQVPPGGSYRGADSRTHFCAVNLLEYSCVTFPACTLATAVSVKSAGAREQQAMKQLQQALVGLQLAIWRCTPPKQVRR